LPGSVTSGTGIALVRPESVDVVASKSGNATVAAASFLGASCRLNITMNDGTKVTAQLPSSDAAGIGAGATVSVSLLDMPVFVKAAG
ncbi:MAG: TOBE domain-containing protein, partial [bacterium]